MASITPKPTITVDVEFVVDEVEARALDALVGYGDDAFVTAFYEHLGKAYMEKYEAGLRRFLTSIRAQMPGVLGRIDAARKAFK